MAWGKAGSTTLTSTGDVITVDSLSNNKFIIIFNNVFSSGQGKLEPTLNNDTGSNYASRYGLDGAAEVTLTSSTDFENTTGGFTNGLTFHVQYLVNIATEEKLLISHSCEVETTGTSGVPRLREYVGKWANTSDAVSRYDVPNVGSGDFKTGSNSTVIGSDITPAAAVPAIDNVQNGSLFVEKDVARRYWFDGTNWTMQPTFQDDFSSDNWTDSNASIGVTNGVMELVNTSASTNFKSVYDLQNISGITYASDKWVLETKVTVTGITTASSIVYFGLSSGDESVGAASSADNICIRWDADTNTGTGGEQFGILTTDGAILNAGSQTLVSTNDYANSDDRWVRIIKDGDTVSIEMYSDSNYNTLLNSGSKTGISAIANLRYIFYSNENNARTGNATTFTFDDMKFYNGVTSIN